MTKMLIYGHLCCEKIKRNENFVNICLTKFSSFSKVKQKTEDFRGSGADEYVSEPAGNEDTERQPPPNVSFWQKTDVGLLEIPVTLLR